LQQLKALADPHILHLPKEIIKDLPPKTRVVEHVPVSSRSHQKHQIALHDLARIVAATKQTRSNNNSKANSNATTTNADNSGDPVMGALSKLRKACSMAKVDAAVSRAKQILQNEAAVVIFTDFQEVAENICNQLVQGGWKGKTKAAYKKANAP
jgi:ERCC4-related helicase